MGRMKLQQGGARVVRLVAASLLSMACSSTLPESKTVEISQIPVVPMPDTDEWDDIDVEDDPEDQVESVEPTVAPADPTLPDVSAKLARSADCSKPTCLLRDFVPDPTFTKAPLTEQASPAAIWAHNIKAKSTLAIPRHQDLDLYGVVLSGEVLAGGDDGGQKAKLGSWGAFRALGAGVTVTAQTGAVVLLALATKKEKETLDAALAEAKKKPWVVRWKKRGVPFATADFKSIDPKAHQGGALQARVAFNEQPKRLASLGVLIGSKDLAMPLHKHADATWEHVIILAGSGTMKLGGKSSPVAPGAIFHVGADTDHNFESSKQDSAVAIQLYTPPGPEQRWLKAEAGDEDEEDEDEDEEDEDEEDED